MILAGKSSVRRDVAEANAENDGAGVYESIVLIAESATLAGLAASIGLG